ncbi:MAG: hypothetical protein FWG64_12195 [Firmicutes bacterium]|nr:hypothetical protein [Bacillota bacterium]
MKLSKNLYNLILDIKLNPALYLGKPTLTGLQYFISGYVNKEIEVDEKIEVALDLFEFNNYLEDFYGILPVSKNCFMVIGEHCETDERAFYLFFELLQKFCEGKC